MGRGRRLAQHVPARTAWPTLHVLEPMSGEFGVLQPPNNPRIAAEESTFMDLYTSAIHNGLINLEQWHSWCNKTGIPFTPWHETSGVVRAETLIPLEVLSNLCEDFVPHIGAFIHDLLWGGFAGPTILSGAIASTLPLLKNGQCVLAKVADRRPKLTPAEYHQSLTAHHRTPTMIWRKSGNSVYPALPLAQQYHPSSLNNLEYLPDTFVGKIICINHQWVPHFVAPVHQPEIAIRVTKARLLLAWFRYRRHSHNICLEDILRERSDIIYRTNTEIIINS